MIKLTKKKIKDEGLDPDKEHLLKFPDGTYNYIDIAGTDTDGQFKKLVQVGIQNKNGQPVARERKVIEKVLHFFGINITFVAYKTAGKENKPENN